MRKIRKSRVGQRNYNWNMYLNRWLLLKDNYNRWWFGRLENYNNASRQITMMILQNNRFTYTTLYGTNISDGWVVSGWSRMY